MHRQSMKKDREIERDRDMSYMQQARQINIKKLAC